MKFLRMLVPSLLTVVLLTSCAGSPSGATSNPGSSGTRGGLTKVTFGALPIANVSALLVGESQGFFKDEGIDLDLSMGQGGNALLPAVHGGSLEFALSGPVVQMVAKDKGLDMKIISGYSSSLSEGEDVNAVVARGDSGIISAKDLAGKRVALNTIQAQGDLTIMESVALDGGDPSSIEFVEMPFADMPAALDRGAVDGVWVPDPFFGQLQSKGGHIVVHPYQATVPGQATLLVFTSNQFASTHPELVARMQRALKKTLDYAGENPEALKKELPAILKMTSEAANAMRMEAFTYELGREQFDQLGDLMVKYDYTERKVDVASLFWDGK